MTVNNELHEMENQVTRGAKSADAMPKAPNYVPDAGSVEKILAVQLLRIQNQMMIAIR